MKIMRIVLLISLLLLPFASAYADDPPKIPTPLPKVYSQEGINEMMRVIEERYGIGFAFPEEWIAGTSNEVQWFTDDLHGILGALDIASTYLYIYGEAPEDTKPPEFFRHIFDPAKIKIDRASQIPGGFTGNTLPVYEDSKIDYYLIQLHPAAMGGMFVLIHELGHVLDGLLEDQPHLDFIAELGGEMTNSMWIPGEDYIGNEDLFPRGVAGPNEDFADTFANMLLGRLSEDRAPLRYAFMREYFPQWIAALDAKTDPVVSQEG